jgi:hypothetical protein
MALDLTGSLLGTIIANNLSKNTTSSSSAQQYWTLVCNSLLNYIQSYFPSTYPSDTLSVTNNIYCGGSYYGNGSGLTSVNATTATITADVSATTYYPYFGGATANQSLKSSTNLSYVPSTGTLSATNFVGGSYYGNGSGLTSVNATTATITADVSGTTYYPYFGAATANQSLKSSAYLTYTPSTSSLYVTTQYGYLGMGGVYGGPGVSPNIAIGNTLTGVTNGNKFLRVNYIGGLEVINSAYSAVIATLDDTGNLSATGSFYTYQVTGITSVTWVNWFAPTAGQSGFIIAVSSAGVNRYDMYYYVNCTATVTVIQINGGDGTVRASGSYVQYGGMASSTMTYSAIRIS